MKIQSKIKAISLYLIAMILIEALFVPCIAAPEDDVSSDLGGNNAFYNSSELNPFLSYLKTVENIYPAGSYPAGCAETVLKEGDSLDMSINVAEAGLYAMRFTYKVIESRGQYPSVTVCVNSSVPYREAASVNLMRRWQDAEKSNEILTNDIIPEQKEVFEKQTVYLSDTVKYYGDTLYFYLEKGENSVSIISEAESIEISDVVFENPKAPQPYKQAEKELSGKSAKGEVIEIEGEAAAYKSDASLYALNDNSSAGVSPSSPYKKYLNIIGASNWENMGQYIEWQFDVPKDGLYQIAVKYRQSINIGMTSYRRILIDDTVPYSELETVAFPYTVSYKNNALSDKDGNVMSFYLEKGSHTIRMETVIGELNTVLPYLEDVIIALNAAYRSIIMVTGSNPDPLRDYLLEDVIPDTIASLDTQCKTLKDLCKRVEKIVGGGSSGTKIMGTVYEQLEEFVDDPYNLTSALADFKSNISLLSTWLIDAKTQPLSVDYITVAGINEELRPAKPGFFESIKFSAASFLYTFTEEYKNHSGEDNVITVWLSSGATQHAIVSQLAKAEYKENDKSSVEIKLVTSSLISAIIAGKAPDVFLGAAPEAVMNFAFRKSLVEMTALEDFDKVKTRFRESAFEPVTFDKKIYALPLTQTYQMLFYRSDVLKAMNIKVPDTWNEVISAMAALKKKNLEFGVPSDINSYLTLLFQRGGNLYNDERSASSVTDYYSIEAFTTFSSWFTEYKSPISYNALQRFRTGEMPLLISDYTMYNSIDILAPEIKNLWGITMIPGTETEEGINRSVASTGTYGIILNEKEALASWEFLKWWTSDKTQINYAKRLEMALGQSGRYNTANLNAFDNLGYTSSINELLSRQGDCTVGVPNAPGGYYVSRYLTNALNKVLYQGEIPGDALHGFSKIIDDEIKYKREEFGLD